MDKQIQVITFYKFKNYDKNSFRSLKTKLETIGAKRNARGLLIIAKEGCNSTLSAPAEEMQEFKEELKIILDIPDLEFKNSFCDSHPFKRFKIDLRESIVNIGKDINVPKSKDWHLNPSQWNKAMQEEDSIVIDTRNYYETALGKFKKALDPEICTFSDFPEYLEENQVPKDKKILIYCTGGIRCEKALIDMHELGYNNVFQLDGGILKYIEEYPNQEFEGECFVFDQRVSLNQELKPSTRYKLCPHTGDPAEEKIKCKNCSEEAVVAKECLEVDYLNTCSKDCAYRWRRTQASCSSIQP